MFAIRLLPPDRLRAKGERLGEIVVGDFREDFACHLADAVPDLEGSWRTELEALICGEPVAVLRHDSWFAWVIYREGGECFVQQRFSLDSTFGGLLHRVVVTEDGDAVSTWATSVGAIRQFLDAESGAAPDPAT